MRATQFVRRGLIAFAAVATFRPVSLERERRRAPRAVIDGDDAIVWNPIPGLRLRSRALPDGARTALLADLQRWPGLHPVAVRFLPEFDGAAIMNIVLPDVIAERQ